MSEADGPRDPDPVRSTVAGVDLVTIPVEHYAELLRCRQALAKTLSRQPPPEAERRRERGPRPSTLDRDDPETAAFLRKHFAAGSTIEAATSAFWKANGRRVSYQRARSLWHQVRSERP